MSENTETSFEARIVNILEEREVEFEGIKQPYQKLEITGLTGQERGQKIIVENGNLPVTNVVKYRKYDKVIMMKSENLEGGAVYQISDVVRRDGLLLLLVIFTVATIVVSKWRGAWAMISMILSFLIIIYFVLPQILAGVNPVLVSIVASAMMVPITFYMSHGFNRKTTVAVVGTFLALVITGVLAKIFVELTHLSGFSSEEAGFLLLESREKINMSGLLLAGVVIGALGVLDDVTISQASVVEQLLAVSEKIKTKEAFGRAMRVGQDHITSMINTLVLVYAGASLPLLLIFVNNPHPFLEVINYEFIAEEIVRTLVGSIGLIVAVPITTLLACWVFNKSRR